MPKKRSELSEEELIALRKKNAEEVRASRERKKKYEAKKADPKKLLELQELDASEEFFHASECRSRAEVYGLYIQHAAAEEILGQKRTFEEWLDLRDLYRKNLFRLAKELLGFVDLHPRVHQPVCDVFVQKNFDKIYKKNFTIADIKKAFWRLRESRSMNMLLLDARGFFKTSIDLADITQWLLNCPDVRILLLTAEHGRAIELLEAVKAFFSYDEEAEEVSDFLLIYPEYRLTGVDAKSSRPLQCPARVIKGVGKRVGASLWVKSQSSQKTGSHADVIKRDDIVTPENSENPETRAKVTKSADDTANLIDKHGFIDTIGTRYSGGKDPDYYGVMIRRVKESREENDLKYFVRPALEKKPEYREVKLKDLTMDMVNLTFPELHQTPEASFKDLRKLLLDNEISFRNQQLNEPIDDEETSLFRVQFTRDLLRANSYPLLGLPRDIVDTIAAGDLAETSGGSSDYSALVVGKTWPVPKLISTEQQLFGLTVVEVKFGKFKQSELPFHFVDLNTRYSFTRPIYVEKSGGHELLTEKIYAEALRRGGKRININWFPVSNVKDAKANRIKGLEILLNEGRLKFVNGDWIDQMYEQFEQFTSEKGNRGHKDDIIDAITFLVKMLPMSSQPHFNAKVAQREQEEAQTESMKKEQYQRIFGTSTPPPGKSLYAPPVPLPNSRSQELNQALRRVMGRQ